MSLKIWVVVTAGGMGLRFGGNTKKQFLKIGEETLLERVLRVFLQTLPESKIVVTLPPDEISTWQKSLQTDSIHCVVGGATRAESVANGIRYISLQQPCAEDAVVLVHDAVRALIDSETILRVKNAVLLGYATVPVLPVKDTIKWMRSESPDTIKTTLPRDELRIAQTPQGGLLSQFKTALDKVDKANVTDEGMWLQNAGYTVKIVDGNEQNIKITTPQDLKWALWHLGEAS